MATTDPLNRAPATADPAAALAQPWSRPAAGVAGEGDDAPRIVAIETSSRMGAVAVARGPQLLAQRQFTHGLRHAVELVPAIRDLTQAQGWKPADIQQVYISSGPGSFTGVRIAVTVARALNQAVGCHLVAVCTVDVLALNAPPETPHVVVILDAKRGQVFAARYRRAGAKEQVSAAGAEPPFRVGPFIRTAGPVLADPRAFVDASPRPLALLGEGVAFHRAAWQGQSPARVTRQSSPACESPPGALPAHWRGERAAPALQPGRPRICEHAEDPQAIVELSESLWAPQVANVLALGWALAQAGQFIGREALRPTYLRPPEAEEVRQARQVAREDDSTKPARPLAGRAVAPPTKERVET